MNEWIKCSEKLPTNGQWVICYSKSINIKFFENTKESYMFYDGDFYCYLPVGLLENVTHWMKLPEKPNE